MNAKDTTQVVDHFAKELAGQFHLLAPQALKVLGAVKQMDSIGAAVSNALWLVVASVAAIILIRSGIKKCREYDGPLPPSRAGVMLCIVGIIAAIVAVISFAFLTDQWLWIGIFRPDLAVYHDIVVKVIGK